MSLKNKLKQMIPMIAVGATLLAPKAPAQTQSQTNQVPQPTTQVQQVKSESWDWDKTPQSQQDRYVYESLPAQYKAFANKSFVERLEMAEEMEQRDYLKRDRKRTALLQKNPEATVTDFGGTTTVSDLMLKDVPIASVPVAIQITSDVANGKLSMAQGELAEQLIELGRPLSTIDTTLPYAEQLRLCGFEKMADIATGQGENSLSARDRSIYIAEHESAKLLNDYGNNPEAARAVRIRLAKENDKEWAEKHGFIQRLFQTKTRYVNPDQAQTQFEKINGKTVPVPHPKEMTYSIRGEITRKVAQKIANEETINNQIQKRINQH